MHLVHTIHVVNGVVYVMYCGIKQVKKDTYRQDEIIALWKNKLEGNKDYILSKWKFTVTSGGYIRYLANKMAGCCYDIERVCYHDL